ncbi:MAG: ATP-binding cassette domain-containing protein [Candidatus Omnitrophica bacterium]|nr:ATP-binding cassette domain-containing protein [Candidatus Omnitrophota bacterium]
MILEARNITKEFSVEKGFLMQEKTTVRALDNVSFSLAEFTTLGIVGESGSGKTTLAKIITRLIPATSGQVLVNTDSIRAFRKDVQIIFQNPYNSLDPRMRIRDAVSEPLAIHRIVPPGKFRDRCVELLRSVGLDETALERYPKEFSGGQRQRICIARALACEPKLLVLDEPLSSLDLTIQARLLDLFIELKKRFALTYVFISHNLSVVRHISDNVAVMQNGRVVEEGTAAALFQDPRQPYTRQLLAAARSNNHP